MINRILIRIKVVQTLYTYMLTERAFELEEMPAQPTKEGLYSYSLYRETLALLILLSYRIERRKDEYPLQNTRLIKRMKEEPLLQNLLKASVEDSTLWRLADDLAPIIESSDVYQGYLKELKKETKTAEEDMWGELLRRVLFPSAIYREYAVKKENFSDKGFERSQEMILETVINFLISQDVVSDGLKTLESSLEKGRELYFRLLALAVDLTDLQERKLDDGRHKILKENKELYPNLKFVENKAIETLRYNSVFSKYIDSNQLYWYQEEPLLMENLLKAVVNSEPYKLYMESPERSLSQDCELWRELFRKVLLVNEGLLETLEEKSVYWNDDVDIIGTFVIKTFRRIEDGEASPLLGKYKDEEDARFGSDLMRKVYDNRELYKGWIEDALTDSGWEADRMSFIDRVIILTALAEILNFPKIPLQVSINEYIEIAKSYSSAKSGSFVHGLLSRIISRLQADGILMKK